MQVLIEVKSTSNVVVDLSGAELEVFSRILGKMKFCESRYGLENAVLVESAVKGKDVFKLELSDVSVYLIPEYEEAKAAHDERQAAKAEAEADRVKRVHIICDCFVKAAEEGFDAPVLYRTTFIAVATGAGFLYNSEAKSLGGVIADVDLKRLSGDYINYSGDWTTLTLDALGGHTKTKL